MPAQDFRDGQPMAARDATRRAGDCSAVAGELSGVSGNSTLQLTERTASKIETASGTAFRLRIEINPSPPKAAGEQTHGSNLQSLSTSKWMISVKSYRLMFSALS
jgi:hypothetical protein